MIKWVFIAIGAIIAIVGSKFLLELFGIGLIIAGGLMGKRKRVVVRRVLEKRPGR